WDAQSRTLLITDLGLLAQRTAGDLWIEVLSTGSLAPLPGVRLDLVSSTNQVIRSLISDAQGRAHFGGLDKQGAEQFDPFVVVAEKGSDFSYLRLDRDPLPTSAFDVGGDPYVTAGFEAFLASDRGLYRPGESAHVTAFLRRNDLGAVPPGLPVTLRLSQGGDELTRWSVKTDAQGMAVFDWNIPKDLATGDVEAALWVGNDNPLAQTTLKVEEFIPEKIRVRADAAPSEAFAGTAVALTVTAEELFGGPAKGLRVRGNVVWRSRLFQPQNWDGFHFADDSREFSVEFDQLDELDTDAKGQADYTLQAPDGLSPPSMLEGVVEADVLDSGGRPVGASTHFLAHVYPYYLGIKLAEGQRLRANQPMAFDFASVMPTGKGINLKAVPVAVKRRVWYSLFSDKGMHWSGWDSQFYDEVVLHSTVDLSDGRGSFHFTPDKAGDYTVVLGGPDGHRASLEVGVSGEATDSDSAGPDLRNPDRLNLTMDKARYRSGEIAHVQVHAPFAGRLVLSVEREKVLWQTSVMVPEGVSTHDVPVPAEAAPNVYAVGLLVRGSDEKLRELPAASFGVAPLGVDCGDDRIKASFVLPSVVRSREGVSGRLVLGRGAAGASVVIAAVDEGILQIINFSTPDPFAWAYRKRGLDVSTLCGLADLLPDLQRKEAVGGDEDEAYSRRHLNPVEAQRVKPMVWFSGPLKVGRDGVVHFKVPTRGFHGELRFMAMAAKGRRFGSAEAKVKVDDPIIVEAPLPRFAAPGDEFEVPVTLFNRSGSRQSVEVGVHVDGPLKVDGDAKMKVDLAAGEQTLVSFYVKALDQAGKAVVRTTATCVLGSFDDETELPIRPVSPLRTEVASGRLNPGGTTSLKVPSGFIREGLKVRLTVSSSRLLEYLRSLDYLVSYPYGCGE
ncbi:MAG TPA: MG2 domain-containing protein, partial [bacterium]|nr:MG2 domain-containing protein [bacterium]